MALEFEWKQISAAVAVFAQTSIFSLGNSNKQKLCHKVNDDNDNHAVKEQTKVKKDWSKAITKAEWVNGKRERVSNI